MTPWKGRGLREGVVSAFHRVITLSVSKVGRRKEGVTKGLRINWESSTEKQGRGDDWRREEKKCGALLTPTSSGT